MGRVRRLRIRGKEVRVEEVPGVYAVNTRAGDELAGVEEVAGGAPRSGPLPTLDAAGVASLAPRMRRASVEALQRAGWAFVRSADRPPPGHPVAKLFVLDDGQPVLSSGRMVVGLRESVTEGRAAELLQRFGGRIIERFTFAPGLYHVEIDDPAGKDVLDAAAALDAEEEVEFAEPEFIEVITGR